MLFVILKKTRFKRADGTVTVYQPGDTVKISNRDTIEQLQAQERILPITSSKKGQTETHPRTPAAASPQRLSREKKQRHLWIAVPSIILLIITLILSYRYYERKQLQAADKSIKSVSVVPVKTMISSLQNIDRYVRSSGVSKAWQQAIILSEVAGQVTSITAKVGDPLNPNAP
ncbi:MAG: hypothetical protein GY868_21475, partial [Deltaproteobacteria bacterium]|nr:hypothetical protein [Deltaproteobacteria bacterium]